MASKLGRIVLLVFLFVGISHPSFASIYGSVTIIGTEQSSNGVWDTGTVTVTVNGHSETVAYGQFSTPASIASALAVKFTKNCGCQGGTACARANGAEIIFKGKNGASINSIAVSSTSTAGFASSSFYADTSRGSGATPNISSLSPTSGKPGTLVSISGGGFGAAAAGVNLVTINGMVAFTSSWTDTSIVFTVPDGASTGEVIITASGVASNGVTFTVDSDGGPSPILSGTLYSYTATGYEDNGNVTDFTDSVTGKWHFSYDQLNRLSTGTAGSGPYQGWGPYMCWFYDPFGNRTGESLSSTQCNASPAYTTYANYDTNNRVTGTTQAPAGYTYDAAGNVLNDGLNKYLYDGDGKVCAVQDLFTGATFQYIYDPEGNRVAKGTTNVFSCNSDSNGFTLTEHYVVGQSGEQISETDGGGAWAHTNVYAGGEVIATYDLSGLHFNLTDPVGTKRVQVLADLSAYEDCSSLSFGNMMDCFGPNASTGTDEDASEQHFASLEHDFESGLDHAMFREYNSMLGRWISPDPYSGSYDLSDPQSLNRYAYVENSPLMLVDPSGLAWGSGGGGGCGANCATDIGEGGVLGAFFYGVYEGLKALFGFGAPSFHGSLTPRPSTGTPDWGNDPGSFGETLGLPNNGPSLNAGNLGAIMGLPGAGCEFGACGGDIGMGLMEGHHIFSQELRDWFQSRGLDVDEYILPLERAVHRLRPNGIHTRGGGNWNEVWRQWRAKNPNATLEEIMNQGKQMLKDFGIGGPDTLPDLFIIINPCVANPTLSFCPGMSQGGTPIGM